MPDYPGFNAEILRAEDKKKSLEGRLDRRKRDRRKYVVLFALTLVFTLAIVIAGIAVSHPIMVGTMALAAISSLLIGFGLMGHILENKEILATEREIEEIEETISELKAVEAERILKGYPDA